MPTASDTAVRPRLLLGGEWVEGEGESFADVNPADPSDVLCEVRNASTEQLLAGVAAAAGAASAWRETSIFERSRVLTRAADHLAERAESIGAELAREEGKTRAEATGEVGRAVEILRFFAGEASRAHGSIYPSSRAGETIQAIRRPLGVVAVITPWNFPIAIPAWKIAPALLYGNTVVWKPASLVPVLATRLAEALLAGGLPPGVLSLVFAEGRESSAIIEHDSVHGVTFTGSTAVGREIAASCGRLLKPVQLELGGSNAAIVMAGPDLEAVADEILSGAMRSTGQKCTATSRLIVEDAVAAELLEILRGKAEALVVGDPLAEGTYMGPLSSGPARDEVLSHVTSATAQGASVLVGGKPYADGALADGYFVPPTVLELPSVDLDIWRTEVFGPVLTVVRARSFDHALELANDSDYGLSAAVFTDRLGLTLRAIDEVDVGVLHINSETPGSEPHVPFGGIKNSGVGPKEQGEAARDFFTVSKTVYLRAMPSDS